GLKVGESLLTAAINEAEKRGLKEQKLSAQVQAIAFYERFGFTVVSDEFLEAGLPHVNMVRQA
uniref:GNAT family N-acetyltransferase n=1 Tax=Pseudomonas viridiflava TaxID=33069 RepID=UPI000F09327E